MPAAASSASARPVTIMRIPASHTGRALIEAEQAMPSALRGPRPAGLRKRRRVPRRALPTAIEIRGAREHNLKNVDVNLGLNRFTVITGVSGSGKSTLAFDILFAEGQRRYLESLNAYARQFVQPASRPDVDAIFGIPPTVAIEQRTSRGGHKSTVATLTEIYHFLRLLLREAGSAVLPGLRGAHRAAIRDAIAARLLKDYRGKSITLLAPLIVARKGLYTALAKWARGKGFSHLRVDGALLPDGEVAAPRPLRRAQYRIAGGDADGRAPAREAELRRALGPGIGAWTRSGACAMRPAARRRRQRLLHQARLPELRHRLSRNSIRACSRSIPEHGWCKSCFGTGLQLPEFDAEQSGEEAPWREADGRRRRTEACPCADCAGQRLNPVALHVLFRGQSIAALTGLPVQDFSAHSANSN